MRDNEPKLTEGEVYITESWRTLQKGWERSCEHSTSYSTTSKIYSSAIKELDCILEYSAFGDPVEPVRELMARTRGRLVAENASKMPGPSMSKQVLYDR